jgi:hypothetical protein
MITNLFQSFPGKNLFARFKWEICASLTTGTEPISSKVEQKKKYILS